MAAQGNSAPLGWTTIQPATEVRQANVPSAGFDRLPDGSVFSIEPAFDRFQGGQSLRLGLPDGSTQVVRLDEASRHPGGHRSLRLRGEASAQADGLLTVGPEAMYGKLVLNGQRYRLHSDASGTWLIDIDHPAIHVHQDCPVGHAHGHPNGSTTPDFRAFQPPRPDRIPEPAAAAAKSGELVQIDQMIIYTADVAERYPGSQIETRLHHLVNLTNQAMADSNLNVVLRLVHFEQTDYDRNVTSQIGLVDMRNAMLGQPVAGFETLADTRDQFGADLVAMIWAADIETRGACGIAFFPLLPEGSSDFDPSVGVQISADGVSNWSVCSDTTFVHEVGHQLGAHHQRESFNPDFLPDTTGFALVETGRFNTVMSSLSSADVNRFKRLNVYSNPDIQCGGQACGSNQADGEINNAEVIAAFAPIVAGYLEPVVPGTQTPPLPSFPDSDGDGVNDWEDAFPFDPFDGAGPQPPEPSPWTPLPRFDGSDLDHWELLVASSASDQIHAWRLDGSPQGLLVQAQPDGFPDERPAFSEYTRIVDHPNGLIYALSSGDVRRFDRLTGQQHDILLDSQPPVPQLLSGGFPKALMFHPDTGALHVSGLNLLEAYDDDRNRIGVTAVPRPEGGGFVQPHGVRDFVPAATGPGFFALEALTGRVLAYQNANDFSPQTVAGVDPAALSDPWAIALGPDGSLFIANGSAGNILRIDPDGGSEEWIAPGTAGLSFARDLAFGPDGALYVLDRDQSAVLRFDGQNGVFQDYFIGPASSSLEMAESLLFVVRPDILLFQDRFEPR
ncbi:MAG: reprolysin-like metallopeptidase [Wenzhouxiangella sp.]